MRKLTVIHDSREQFPLLFPSTLYWRPDDETTVFKVVVPPAKRLLTSDYYIDGHKQECMVERKASISELRANLFGTVVKRNNFLAALDRMRAECEHPILFLDMRWDDLWELEEDARGAEVRRCPFPIYDHLFQELFCRGIELIGPIPARTINQRRMCGDWLLRLMLARIFPRRSWSGVGVKGSPIVKSAFPT